MQLNKNTSLHSVPASKINVFNFVNLQADIFSYEEQTDRLFSATFKSNAPRRDQYYSHTFIKKPIRQRQAKRITVSQADLQKEDKRQRIFKKTQVSSQTQKKFTEDIRKTNLKSQTQNTQQRLNAKYTSLQIKRSTTSISNKGQVNPQKGKNMICRYDSAPKKHIKTNQQNIAKTQTSIVEVGRCQHQTRLQKFIKKYRSSCSRQKQIETESHNQYRQIQDILSGMGAQRQSKCDRTVSIVQNTTVNTPQNCIQKVHIDLQKQIQNKLNVRPRTAVNRIKQGTILKQRYKIIQKIGQGLSGQVYKAQDILANRPVAIKITVVQKLQKQHQFYKKIQHKNIVAYFNSFQEHNKHYLILQYLPYTLSNYLRTNKLQNDQIKNIFRNLVHTIHYLHGLGVAHRDIKLENIVVNENLQQIKFIDFGLCLDLNDLQKTLSRQFCGTIHYMPPQILQKKQYNPKKADVWSLGIVLYKLLFDRFPFRGKDQRQMLLKMRNSRLVFPQNFDQNGRQLINGMLCRQVQKRLDIEEVIEHQWLS